MPFLVHADGAVHAIVDDDDDDRQLILHGGREFLPGHEKVAVACKRYHHALGRDALQVSLGRVPSQQEFGQVISELAKAGVGADMIRLSVGIEDVEDILWDIDQALRKAVA